VGKPGGVAAEVPIMICLTPQAVGLHEIQIHASRLLATNQRREQLLSLSRAFMFRNPVTGLRCDFNPWLFGQNITFLRFVAVQSPWLRPLQNFGRSHLCLAETKVFYE